MTSYAYGVARRLAVRTSVLTWLLMLAAHVDPSAVAAQSDERARLHFASGSSYFNVGDYDNALREYESAHALSERPELLYNIALCHERLGNLEAAVENMGEYLATAENIADRETLEERYANMQRRLERESGSGTVEPERPANADANDNASRPIGASPSPDEATPAPETAASTEASLEVSAGQGEPAPSSGGVPVAAIASFAAGGAGLVTFAIFGGLALGKNSELSDCSPNCESTGSLRTYTILADVGLGVAAVGAALGVVFLLTADDEDEAEALSASPFVAPGAAGVMARGSF